MSIIIASTISSVLGYFIGRQTTKIKEIERDAAKLFEATKNLKNTDLYKGYLNSLDKGYKNSQDSYLKALKETPEAKHYEKLRNISVESTAKRDLEHKRALSNSSDAFMSYLLQTGQYDRVSLELLQDNHPMQHGN